MVGGPITQRLVAECPGDATKALCKYCTITTCARYASTKQHVTAKKQFAKADPSMLLDSLLFLVKSLFQHIVIPSQTSVLDPFTCDFENFVNQTPYLGYETEQLIHNENFSVTEQETIRKDASIFLSVSSSKLGKEFPQMQVFYEKCPAYQCPMH